MPEKRLLDDWLTAYLEYTAEQESPESLHLWTALTLISAVVRRKVYLDLEHGRIFPNMYVIIVAESARVRKSTAMDLGRDLLTDAFPDIRIMRDSMTSQGLIKSLNHKVQVVKDDKIVEELRSDVAIFADEVANLFSYERTRAAQMVIFLTRTYGCPAVYDHTTVRDSTVRLHNLYPVLLGGTDPRNLKVLPDEAVAGLTGRLIWVIESQRRRNNPGWKKSGDQSTRRQLMREMLMHDLHIIGNLHGEVHATPDAMAMYDKWYDGLSQRDTKDPEADAFYQRCHTTAQRASILLSLSGGNSLCISQQHMERAIKLIESQLPELKKVMIWGGGSDYEQKRAKIIYFLQRSGGVSTRKQTLRHMGMQSEDFEKLYNTLVQDGTCLPARGLGSETALQLTKEGMSLATSTQKKT